MRYLLNCCLPSAGLVAARPGCSTPRFARASTATAGRRSCWGAFHGAAATSPASGCTRSASARSTCCSRCSTRLARQRPTWECVISTTTRTGYRTGHARSTPLIASSTARSISAGPCARAMRRIRPDLLVLAELELWPNLIQLAHEQGARVAVVNGRLSDNSFRGYRRIRPLVRSDLQADRSDRRPESTQYAERFLQLGAPPRDGVRDRLDEVRRGRDRSPQSGNTALALALADWPTTTSSSWPAARRIRRSSWRSTLSRRSRITILDCG